MEGSNKSDFVKSQVQGSYKLELKFVDNRIYFNWWDLIHGHDVATEIKDGKIMEFVFTESEVNEDDFEGDPYEQKELSLMEFIDKVKSSIAKFPT